MCRSNFRGRLPQSTIARCGVKADNHILSLTYRLLLRSNISAAVSLFQQHLLMTRLTAASLALLAALTACDGTDPSRDPCPDIAAVNSIGGPTSPGRIVFSSNDGFGHWQLYSIDPDGSDRTQLTFSDPSKDFPAWSPDGREIVFISDSLGSTAGWPLYRMNSDGSNVRPVKILHVYQDGEEVLLVGGRPDWSPDGRFIAFQDCPTCEIGLNDHEIRLIDLDQDTVYSVSKHSGSDEYPRWSPDGSRIAFSSDRDAGDGSLTEEIYSVDRHGGNLSRLTFLETRATSPIWVPDGQRFAFATSGEIRLQHLSCDSSIVAAFSLPGRHLRAVSWSPDGARLLVVASSRVSTDDRFLYVADLDTRELHLLVTDEQIGWGDWLWQ